MEPPVPGPSKNSSPASPAVGASRTRSSRAKKRKRLLSNSSSDTEDVLPENAMEVDKSLHASAVKNNLDDVSVKKILKKVVTNDHVLALVKLREEEEKKATKVENLQPKLTRAKVKELMKVSPKTAWNLENLELTPIKHIPVKTRPEVKALIAHELHDDEEDDEYQPTNDDVPSDDDHTLESCSDLDSQPRTPATPRSTASPRVLRDGPFKVPQELTPRRKLDLDEDATIALRTRSKLSLSSIPIDTIESSFVPPDELPMPIVDDVWTEFLQECMNPETSKNEDDDDDPEYNVAADPDALDEDEEGLENIMKISKKELNDLVTELFNIMPEATAEEVLAGKLASDAAAEKNTLTQPSHWEGKQEPLSDDETANQPAKVHDKREKTVSIGKCEPLSDTECPNEASEKENERQHNAEPISRVVTMPRPVTMAVVEASADMHGAPGAGAADVPAPLRHLLQTNNKLTVHIEQGVEVLPEQILILQQQLRQHVQLATSNFLQLFVHPVHWALAPGYKEYLEVLDKMASEKADSVVNVCNLRPALALARSWEESVSADTPENTKMVEFVHTQVERSRRRAAQNNLYVGDFHEMFMNVVANSSVFLYPHLLPPLPYRSDCGKRFHYLRSEDELIALGMDQFWDYVEVNGELFRPPAGHAGRRWGLAATVQLMCRHLLPWLPPKAVLCHVQHVRKSKQADNPIIKFLKNREVTPVKHELLPYNPHLTLYEQPEHEMPRIWVRHLAKSSKRFRDHFYRRTGLNKAAGNAPVGVPVELGDIVEPPKKKPLPIDFTQEIVSTHLNVLPRNNKPTLQDKFDIELKPPVTPATTQPVVPTVYSVVQTLSGAYLVPLTMIATNTVGSASAPISSSEVKETVANDLPQESNVPTVSDATVAPVQGNHCACCVQLRKICKVRQTIITDFFTPRVKMCPCKEKRRTKYPMITKKLRLLVNNYKSKSLSAWQGLRCRLQRLTEELKSGKKKSLSEDGEYDLEEIVAVTSFQLRLTIKTTVARNNYMKKKVDTILSKFIPDNDDPCILLGQLDKALEVECVDVYKEFIGFMTPLQADKMGRYMDYFKQEYLTDLMKRIEEQVPNRHHKLNILKKLHRLLSDATLTPCEVCVSLLGVLNKYPELAKHVFSLFLHRREKSNVQIEVNQPEASKHLEKEAQVVQEVNSNVQEEDETIDKPEEEEALSDESQVVGKGKEGDDTNYGESQTMDYEADHSESDDDGSFDNNLTIVEEPDEIKKPDFDKVVEKEESISENVIDTPHLTVTKTEVQNHAESDMSMTIMSEDEIVKSEPPEWKRDEDKLLLEILKQSLTPEERKATTIVDIFEEKNVLRLVAESLSHKSLDDVRERMIYLLEMIAPNNDEQ